MERLNLLYRGPLSSCNYECDYCPFAKRKESAEELQLDRESLSRFIGWLKERTHRQHGVFFTPWGEATTRRWYREAMISLSHSANIDRVAVQTNLSVAPDWLEEADRNKIGLWCTYHPSQVSQVRFLERCEILEKIGIRYSVGCVGDPRSIKEISRMRELLPKHVYLWINAMKSSVDYDAATVDHFLSIDSLFSINNTNHPSFGKDCNTGLNSVSIDGDGNVRRCHFVGEIIGNIYTKELDEHLRKRPCPNQTCGCHIGYVHMPSLKLERVFGANILERVPEVFGKVNE
jgi:MoaA/NifB/PqqE/SkfB family radical SAM enzyme